MNKNLLLIFVLLLNCSFSFAQSKENELLNDATLQNCIQYALTHQPNLQQSLKNEQITNKQIKSKLADWFPQINFNFNFQHYFKLPTSIFQGNPTNIGLINTSNAQFTITQNIFNKDLLLASSTAGEVNKQAEQITKANKIDVIINVSKAYYLVLLTQNKIDFINQDILRLNQSLKDSYNQYKSGIVDKTDYMQATIALNNAKAELKQYQEMLAASYSYLKELMGYTNDEDFHLDFDMTKMEDEISMDTTEPLIYQNRIEYKLLQTQKQIKEANLKYYIWSFLPTLSAFGAYTFNFQNNQFSDLYKKNYPNSYIGLQLSVPIFQGGKRFQQIDQAKLELELLDLSQSALQSSINTEYTKALGNYESNLNNFHVQKDNLVLAKDVYKIIELQYKSGVKTYLNLLTAETNLKTTQVNYLNALYQVLISKMDLQKALGTIKY